MVFRLTSIGHLLGHLITRAKIMNKLLIEKPTRRFVGDILEEIQSIIFRIYSTKDKHSYLNTFLTKMRNLLIEIYVLASTLR